MLPSLIAIGVLSVLITGVLLGAIFADAVDDILEGWGFGDE